MLSSARIRLGWTLNHWTSWKRKIHGNFHVGNGILSCQKYGGTYWTGIFLVASGNVVEHIPWKSWVAGFLSHGYACIIVYWQRKKPVPLVWRLARLFFPYQVWFKVNFLLPSWTSLITPDRVTWPSKKGHKELPGIFSYPPVELVFGLYDGGLVTWGGRTFSGADGRGLGEPGTCQGPLARQLKQVASWTTLFSPGF